MQNGTVLDADVDRAYNDFWWDFGKKVVGTRRTSLIVDPPDGKMPALTAEGTEARRRSGARRMQRPAFGPEDRGVGERCILGFNSGPPMLPSAYNNNVQIFQTGDHVALFNEMVHNARIVPLDGRPHLPGERPAVGRRFARALGRRHAGGRDHQLPRRDRVSELGPRPAPDRALHARRTPTRCSTSSRSTIRRRGRSPGRSQIPMTQIDEPMYEYACHEGNYGMMNLLSARTRGRKDQVMSAGKTGSHVGSMVLGF